MKIIAATQRIVVFFGTPCAAMTYNARKMTTRTIRESDDVRRGVPPVKQGRFAFFLLFHTVHVTPIPLLGAMRAIVAFHHRVSAASAGWVEPAVSDEVSPLMKASTCGRSCGWTSTSRALEPSDGPTTPRDSSRSMESAGFGESDRSLRCSMEEVEPNCV